MKTLEDSRKSVGHRLAIIEGHLRKVRQMVDGGADCIDVIHQSRAIEQALRKFDEHVLQQHLHSCIARDIRGDGKLTDKRVDQILQVFTKL